MYRMYGSTVEGIRQMILQRDRDGEDKNELVLVEDEVKEMMDRYYTEVYDGIDYSPLTAIANNNNSNNSKVDTGYSSEKVESIQRPC